MIRIPLDNSCKQTIQENIYSTILEMPAGTENSRLEITAVARDHGANETFSEPIFIDVVPDFVPPFISIVKPALTDQIIATHPDEPRLKSTSISVVVTDNVGVDVVEVFAQIGDGDLVQLSPPYSVEVPVIDEETTLTITANALDVSGNSAVAFPVTVPLISSPGMNRKTLRFQWIQLILRLPCSIGPPTLSLSAPAANATFL